MLIQPSIRICLAGAVAVIALSACDTPAAPISMSVERPQSIEFGTSVDAMQSTLKTHCTTIDIRRIEPPLIDDVETQSQIDCDGFPYFGKPRHAEFIFVNDALMLSWILVENDEIPALETAFTSTFGEPTISKDTILAYAHNFAGVRNDTPEALYYSETAAPYVIDRVNRLPDRD